MPRSLKASLSCVFLVSFLAILPVASPVHATTYTYNAQSMQTPWSNFTMLFNDLDGDGFFSLNELVPGSFSGMRVLDYYDGLTQHQVMNAYDKLLEVANSRDMEIWYTITYFYHTMSDGQGQDNHPAPSTQAEYRWTFGGGADTVGWGLAVQSVGAGNWRYWTSPAPSPIPLPPSAFLLGAGLIGLAGIGLRRRRS